MNKIFKKRRAEFHEQNIKYLRYVFNDHFTLFLLILIGALTVQYAQFLQNHSLSLLEKWAVIIVLSLLALIPGRLATFLEEADKVFLLVREQEVKGLLSRALGRSLILPAVIAIVMLVIANPLLELSVVWLLLWFIVLVLLKAFLFFIQLKKWQRTNVLSWAEMIKYEENRKVSILRFFALFTNVKGLKAHSHRRKYLDFLLPKTRRTYEYALSRSFLRSGDYLGLTLRILLLSLLALIFIKNAIVAVILVCVLNALLVFQLLALREAVDYQLFTRIYPVNKASKATAVQRILLRVIVMLTVVEVVVGVIFIRPVYDVAAILLINFLLAKFYVKSRLKK